MSFLFAALLLPSLFWDKGPETADLLLKAKIEKIYVPPSSADAWKQVKGLTVSPEDTSSFIHIAAPTMTFRANLASATRSPWVNLNGWKFIRQPDGRFFYDAQGGSAALAAAEAYAYGVQATVHTDGEGIGPLGKMLAFLRQAPEQSLPAEANIGFVDDGSAESGEFMNLLVRRNLLFKVVHGPDPKLNINVALGEPMYPREEAANPSLLAEKVRGNLGDDKRLLRVYGSEVVVGRLVGQGNNARLYLINYGALRNPVAGVRIRVLGQYSKLQVTQYDDAETKPLDVTIASGGTEFTLPELKTLAIINLSR